MNSLLRYLLAFVAAVTALAALALPAAADSHVADQYTAECGPVPDHDNDLNTPDLLECDDALVLGKRVTVRFNHLIRWIRANPDLIDIPIYEAGDDRKNEVLLAFSGVSGHHKDEEMDAIVAEAYFTTRNACRDDAEIECPEHMSDLVGSDNASVATLGQLKIWVEAWLGEAKARLLTKQKTCAKRLEDRYDENHYRCIGLYGPPVFKRPDPHVRRDPIHIGQLGGVTKVKDLVPKQLLPEVRVALDATPEADPDPETTGNKQSRYGLIDSLYVPDKNGNLVETFNVVVAKVLDKCFVWDGSRVSGGTTRLPVEVACP